MLLTLSCRFYENPVTEDLVLFQEATVLRIAVEQHLKSKSRFAVTTSVRGNAYRFLFKNKRIYARWFASDKSRRFPCKCKVFATLLQTPIKVTYPMKVKHFISWSPKKYIVEGDHFPTPGAFQERFTFSFVRVALGDTLMCTAVLLLLTFRSLLYNIIQMQRI